MELLIFFIMFIGVPFIIASICPIVYYVRDIIEARKTAKSISYERNFPSDAVDAPISYTATGAGIDTGYLNELGVRRFFDSSDFEARRVAEYAIDLP